MCSLPRVLYFLHELCEINQRPSPNHLFSLSFPSLPFSQNRFKIYCFPLSHFGFMLCQWKQRSKQLYIKLLIGINYLIFHSTPTLTVTCQRNLQQELFTTPSPTKKKTKWWAKPIFWTFVKKNRNAHTLVCSRNIPLEDISHLLCLFIPTPIWFTNGLKSGWLVTGSDSMLVFICLWKTRN